MARPDSDGVLDGGIDQCLQSARYHGWSLSRRGGGQRELSARRGLLQGDQTIAFMLVALIGSLLGFLRYNWHPARIYMGDTGAMFIGLLLGAMTMIERYPSDHPLSLLTPVFIVGIPIFDTLFVMYIRYRRGLPIFWGSPDHIAITAAPLGAVSATDRDHELCGNGGCGNDRPCDVVGQPGSGMGTLRGDSWRARACHDDVEEGGCPPA